MEKTLSLERLVVLVVVKLDFVLVSEMWRNRCVRRGLRFEEDPEAREGGWGWGLRCLCSCW